MLNSYLIYGIIRVPRRCLSVSNEEKIIAEVDSSMTMEGMPLTTEDKNRLKFFLSNPDNLENMINELVKKYTVPQY